MHSANNTTEIYRGGIVRPLARVDLATDCTQGFHIVVKLNKVLTYLIIAVQ